MYIPKAFEITDRQEIDDFIAGNSFGQLVSVCSGELCSTHMPFLLSEDRSRLLGHLARQNPQHVDIENQTVMVTLDGPHDYISPSWYHAPGVPTWNYQSVHLYGSCTVITDSEQIRHIVDSLTGKYESGFDLPWMPEYADAMLRAILGLFRE